MHVRVVLYQDATRSLGPVEGNTPTAAAPPPPPGSLESSAGSRAPRGRLGLLRAFEEAAQVEAWATAISMASWACRQVSHTGIKMVRHTMFTKAAAAVSDCG